MTGQQQWGNAAAVRAAPAPAMGNMMWSRPAAQSWSMASYAAPSSWENSWSNGNGMTNGNGGGAMWYPAPAAAAAAVAERVSAESRQAQALNAFRVWAAYLKHNYI